MTSDIFLHGGQQMKIKRANMQHYKSSLFYCIKGICDGVTYVGEDGYIPNFIPSDEGNAVSKRKTKPSTDTMNPKRKDNSNE
jgi:hypothetical protein